MSTPDKHAVDAEEGMIELLAAVNGADLETLRVPVAELRPVTTSTRTKELALALYERQTAAAWPWPTKWRPAATSKQEYIENAGKMEYIRAIATRPFPAYENPNLLTYPNMGGIMNMGVCWWHSRLTRAALYLAYFLPQAEKPTEAEVKEIVRTLMVADGVVAIPGYSNLRDFSFEHWGIFQKRLETTQLVEGLFLFSWIDGLSGADELPPEKMKEQFDAIYEEVRDEGVAYVKLQMPGIDAHAWIISDMAPTAEGYMLNFIDSNCTGPGTYHYKVGDTHIFPNWISGNLGVPYLQRSKELRRMKRIIARFMEEAR